MKTLYIECAMGAAGDMLMSALSELIDDADGFVAEMNALNLPGVALTRESATKCGIVGTHMKVTVDGIDEGDVHHAADHHGHADAHDHHDGDEHDHHHEGDDHDHHCHTDDHDHHCEGDGHGHHDGDAHEHYHIDEHEHCHCEDEHDQHHADAHAHIHMHADVPQDSVHAHHHAALSDIAALINGLAVSDGVKRRALEVYGLIAEAEAVSHGKPVDQIHFHEVGTADAVADIVGVIRLLELIDAQRVVVSPINVGSGLVRCAHGILPVPAPATAYILRGAPIYGSAIRGELCTPTGAALLKTIADEFAPLPLMRVEKIGYGMGSKDFPAANCVRAYLGQCDYKLGERRKIDLRSPHDEGRRES